MNDHILQEDVDFLAHFGVKGMKWGVRRDNRGPSDIALGRKSRRGERLEPNERRQLLRGSTKNAQKGLYQNLAGVGLLLGSFGGIALSQASKSPKVRAGATVVGSVLGTASALANISALANYIQSDKKRDVALKDLPMSQITKYLKENE